MFKISRNKFTSKGNGYEVKFLFLNQKIYFIVHNKRRYEQLQRVEHTQESDTSYIFK